MVFSSDISDKNVSEDDISVYDSPSTPKWAEKIVQAVGNWQVIPMSLGRLDHKLVKLPLQVIVLLLSTVIC